MAEELRFMDLVTAAVFLVAVAIFVSRVATT